MTADPGCTGRTDSTGRTVSTVGVSGIRIAVVNWRDPWHPAAGGAERYAWELARRFAASGAEVTYLTCHTPPGPADPRARRNRVEGVAFVRAGGRFGVYPRVLLWLFAHRRRFDVVIDCQNGIPFFTPWALPRRVPVFCVIHHVHDQQFGLYFPAWLAWVGRTLEGPVTRWAYRRHAFVVVSPSTRQAVRERLRWRGPAHVVHNGVTTPAVPPDLAVPSDLAVPPDVSVPSDLAVAPGLAGDGDGDGDGDVRQGGPEIVCVTRLVPHKRVERIADLAVRLRDRWPGLRIHIVGDGPSAGMLADRIALLGVGDVIVQHGFVSEQLKAALVGRADLHLSTSRGEGWGLSVIEAAAQGVPTVSYDVEGLRDAVRDGVTGWLVRAGHSEPGPRDNGASDNGDLDPGDSDTDDQGAAALADTVERALKELDDPRRRVEIAGACRDWAGEFDWSRTADRMASLIVAALSTGPATTPVPPGYGDVRPATPER